MDKSTDYPNYYQGLWDCTGDFPDELSFKRGDAIYILSKVLFRELYLRSKIFLPFFEKCFLHVLYNQNELKANSKAKVVR